MFSEVDPNDEKKSQTPAAGDGDAEMQEGQ